MPVDLILVCHASTAAVRSAAFPADDPLERDAAAAVTAVGTAVAAAVAHRPGGQVWCAPSLAARQTAEALGLEATVEPAIRDCDFGRWAGRPVGDVARDEPDNFRAWMTEPTSAPHGGEALTDVLRRVGAWIDGRRVGLGSLGPTVAVTHPAVIRAAIVVAIEATTATFWRLDVGPLSQTWLRSDGQRWTLRSLAPVPPTVGVAPPGPR